MASRWSRARAYGCVRVAVLGVCAAALAACSQAPEITPGEDDVTELATLGAVPDLTMVDTGWDTYRTARIVAVDGAPTRRTIDVAYEGGDASCSGLAGYAVVRTETQTDVTLVLGADEGCSNDPVDARTVVPLEAALGSLDPVAGEYSQESIPIGE